MFKNVLVLYDLLTDETKKKFMYLQVLVVLMSLLEVASVLAIGPFMALVTDLSILEAGGKIAFLYELLEFENPNDFVIFLGLGALLLLVLASVVSMFTIWKLSMFGSEIGAEFSNRLYKHFLYQNWLYHMGVSTSDLTNKISQETSRVTSQIIHPVMYINAKVILAILMIGMVVYIDPFVALAGVSVFIVAYYMLYKLVRRKLALNGNNISISQAKRFKLLSEGFGGIKDVLLLGRQSIFVKEFFKSSEVFSYSQANNIVLQQVPRYAMELVAFSSVIILILFLLVIKGEGFSEVMPLLSVYALASFKLLPAFQQIYGNITKIKGHIAGFENIKNDLDIASKTYDDECLFFSDGDKRFKDCLELKGVSFKYPNKETYAVDDVSLSIPANKMVGFVGASGSGKSTIIDLILTKNYMKVCLNSNDYV